VGFESVQDAKIAVEGFENDVGGSYERGGRMEDDASVVFVYAEVGSGYVSYGYD
jgi:hypothetical protein